MTNSCTVFNTLLINYYISHITCIRRNNVLAWFRGSLCKLVVSEVIPLFQAQNKLHNVIMLPEYLINTMLVKLCMRSVV